MGAVDSVVIAGFEDVHLSLEKESVLLVQVFKPIFKHSLCMHNDISLG